MTDQLTLIAAVSVDGFISKGRGIPWHLPADIAYYRAHTANKWLLIGRQTYGEMTGWFKPGHHPLILSRDPSFLPVIGQRVSSVIESLAQAQGELMVCGGGQVYQAALPHATRLLITRVHTQLGEGVAFPAIDTKHWDLKSADDHPADSDHAFALTFEVWTKVRHRA